MVDRSDTYAHHKFWSHVWGQCTYICKAFLPASSLPGAILLSLASCKLATLSHCCCIGSKESYRASRHREQSNHNVRKFWDQKTQDPTVKTQERWCAIRFNTLTLDRSTMPSAQRFDVVILLRCVHFVGCFFTLSLAMLEWNSSK